MEHDSRAVLAAEIVTGGKYGGARLYKTQYGEKTVRGIADIIQRTCFGDGVPPRVARAELPAKTKRRGRKQTTGRFESRERLVDYVWSSYTHTQAGLSDISRSAQVSIPVVRKILSGPRPVSVPRLERNCVRVRTRNMVIEV